MNLLNKELAKMLKAEAKEMFPFAKFTFAGKTIGGLDTLTVKYQGEVDKFDLLQLAGSFENERLQIFITGTSYKMMEVS
tara:strand:- start:391 stop:627 length:237 start_codon:yes stop_codon:yes gene_type:complete